MSSFELKCRISSTDVTIPLGIEVWVDNQCVLDVEHVSQELIISHPVDDDVESLHSIKFVLKNKLPDHTIIDQSNNIVKDACLVLDNWAIDDINIASIIQKIAKYTHSFNQENIEPVVETFYGTAGCNGTITWQFNTPIYPWILENL